MQRQFVSVNDGVDGEWMKQPRSTKRILRPGIALAVESIARNPINAIHACASASMLIKGLITQNEPSRYNCSSYRC